MAKRELVICDICGKPGETFVLWRDGDATALSLDLCEGHSRTSVRLFAEGNVVDLPSRPRARMEVTTLRTTDKTRGLKKRSQDASQGESK